MEIARGIVKRKVEAFQTFTLCPVAGQLGTSSIGSLGDQYSAIASVGSASVEVFNELLNPGVGLSLQKIKMELTSKTSYLGSAVGSMIYYWKARSEWDDPVGTLRITSYTNLTGTFSGPVGTALGNSYEDTWSGYVPIASLPSAPVRIVLTALATAHGAFTARIRNNSYVQLMGTVIPGV